MNSIKTFFSHLNNKLRMLTSLIRILPDFIIIGAMRSGTSSLYRYIVQNPNVFSALKTEVHYFDFNFKKGTKWYKSHFPTIIYKFIYNKIFKGKFISGEASPSYLFLPEVAKRIHSILPICKIIIILRNPVDRAYSHYFHSVKANLEKRTFKEAITNELKFLSGGKEGINNDFHYSKENYGIFSYLGRGKYYNQINKYLKYFSTKKILIIKSESFFNNTQREINRICDFLCIKKHKVNTSKIYGKSNYVILDKNTRKILMDFFKPFNIRLYEFLGTDLNWEKENSDKLNSNDSTIMN